MIIKDLFSHKIHSSGDNWANKLIDLAFIFSEFDGKPYNRLLLEERLSQISPRTSDVGRDPSKFRDEISAYPAYLGLYRVELINNIWHFVLSDTAKRFLVTEEPNVAAFMILQLLLFQYPNGMGVAYFGNSNNVRIQANTRDRTLDFIKNKVHLSPLRLICKSIQAISIIESKSIFETEVSYDEIFALANSKEINVYSNPPLNAVIESIEYFRAGINKTPSKYESRFHILKYTDFIVPERSSLKLRAPFNEKDKNELESKFNLINTIEIEFNGFDNATNSDEILKSIVNCSWGRYFDGVRTLQSEIVEVLTSEIGIFENAIPDFREIDFRPQPPLTYNFRKRNQSENILTTSTSDNSRIDPELTRIRRQKSNLNHKLILQRLEEFLEAKGCDPLENDHIDLFANIPGNGNFLFEVKSTTSTNLLSQTRKGVSQLYEYRYRYKEKIGYDVSLCLVLPDKPSEIDWLEDYLCIDREIGVIWFNNEGQLEYPNQGEHLVKELI
jgi:hypothetical protein